MSLPAVLKSLVTSSETKSPIVENHGVNTSRPKLESKTIENVDEARLEQAIAEGYERVPGLAVSGTSF